MIGKLFAAGTRLLTGTQPLWLGCEPIPKPRIYYANHTSNLDALVLWASLPGDIRVKTRPVAARDYWAANRIRNHLSQKVFKAVLVERKQPTRNDNPIENMLAAMGDSDSLILFPEGGRNPGPDPVPFKSGLYHLAKRRPDVELIPVLLDNLNRILPKGELIPLPLISTVIFGSPIQLNQNETREEFLDRARQAIIDLRCHQFTH